MIALANLSLILDHLIASVKIIRNKQTGHSEGYGFIDGSDHTIFVGDLAHGVTDSMLEDDDWMAQRIWFGAYTFGTTFRYSIIGYEDERSLLGFQIDVLALKTSSSNIVNLSYPKQKMASMLLVYYMSLFREMNSFKG
ncbi:hypothetical protein ACJX0J_041787, partial [Zea mays]